jgi:hypothetical protein
VSSSNVRRPNSIASACPTREARLSARRRRPCARPVAECGKCDACGTRRSNRSLPATDGPVAGDDEGRGAAADRAQRRPSLFILGSPPYGGCTPTRAYPRSARRASRFTELPLARDNNASPAARPQSRRGARSRSSFRGMAARGKASVTGAHRDQRTGALARPLRLLWPARIHRPALAVTELDRFPMMRF